MKNLYATRLVASVAVVALLIVFAAPAVAAPATGISLDTPWSPTGLFQWVQSLWTGWFGTGSDVSTPSGMRNVYDEGSGLLEPDGVSAATPTTDPTTRELTMDGTF